MLDIIDTVTTTALVALIIGALLVFLDLPNRTRLWLAGLLGLWVGAVVAAGASGLLSIARPFPVMGLFVAAPLLAAGLIAATPEGRRALLGLPTRLLVGLNIGRVFAVMFLILLAQGRLSGPFPYSAAIGDILTGLGAFALLRSARNLEDNVPAVTAWNLFGLADLVAAIGLGVMSGAGSPLQVFAAPGSAAMQALPFSLVPTVLVPLYMIMHAIVWAQLRQVSPSRRVPG